MVSGITGIIIHIIEIYDPTNITNLVAFPYQRSLIPFSIFDLWKAEDGDGTLMQIWKSP